MKFKKAFHILTLVLLVAFLLCAPAFASSGGGGGGGSTGNVAGVVEETWKSAAAQIVKLGSSWFEYRKHGQFEWAGPIILFACLVLTLTAPTYIWKIIGI